LNRQSQTADKILKSIKKTTVMKKLLLATLLAVSVAASAFAKDVTSATAAAQSNFKSEFKRAADVSWSATDQFVKASFVYNNEKMEAFYNANGDKIGTTRAIALEELPVKAKRAFAKKYDGYTVKEAIEFDGTDTTDYYISAENDKESVIIKVSNASWLSTFQKTKK
jgi:opacity protein-like surface antigen